MTERRFTKVIRNGRGRSEKPGCGWVSATVTTRMVSALSPHSIVYMHRGSDPNYF